MGQIWHECDCWVNDCDCSYRECDCQLIECECTDCGTHDCECDCIEFECDCWFDYDCDECNDCWIECDCLIDCDDCDCSDCDCNDCDTAILVTIKYKDPTGTLSESEDQTYYYPQDGYGYFTPPNISKTNINGQKFMWWQESDGTVYQGGEESFIGNKDITLYAYWGSSTVEYPGSNKKYTINYYLDNNKTLFKQEYVWVNEQEYQPSYKIISDIPVASSINLKFDKWDYPGNDEQWSPGQTMSLMGNPVELYAIWKDVSNILRAQAFVGASITGNWNDSKDTAKSKGFYSINEIYTIIDNEIPQLISTYYPGTEYSSYKNLPQVKSYEYDSIYNYNENSGTSYGLFNFETFNLIKENYHPLTSKEWVCIGQNENSYTKNISDDGPWTCQQLIEHLNLSPVNKGNVPGTNIPICIADHYYFDLYPNWESNDVIYTISYDVNGGNVAPENQIKLYQETIYLANAPENYKRVTLDPQGGNMDGDLYKDIFAPFYYWQETEKVDNQAIRNYRAGTSYSVDKSMQFKAIWGKRETINLPTATKIGYIFKGWSSNPNSSTGVINEFTTDEDITLYAIWEAKEYRNYLDPKGGIIYNSSQPVLLKDPYVQYNTSNWCKVDIPTRIGYEFNGWYDGDNIQIYDKNGYCVKGKYWSNDVTGNYIYDNSITAYASWKPLGLLYTKVNKQIKPGCSYVNINNSWKKGTSIFIKVNGEWKYSSVENNEFNNITSAIVSKYDDITPSFYPNGEGYYVSSISGLHNSTAACLVTVTLATEQELIIEYFQYSENHYDYGKFSKLNDINTTFLNLCDSFGNSTFSYGVQQPGVYTFLVQYSKDVSVSQDFDELRFKILNIPMSGLEDYYPPDNYDCNYNDCNDCDCKCSDCYDCDYECDCQDCGDECELWIECDCWVDCSGWSECECWWNECIWNDCSFVESPDPESGDCYDCYDCYDCECSWYDCEPYWEECDCYSQG